MSQIYYYPVNRFALPVTCRRTGAKPWGDRFYLALMDAVCPGLSKPSSVNPFSKRGSQGLEELRAGRGTTGI